MEPDRQLILSYFFPVRSSIVFDAWTNPELMKSWLFKSPDNEIISIKTDLRKGGKFSILELNKNERIDHFGEYLTVEQPHKLVFTLEVPWHFKGVSKVSVEMKDKVNGCDMTFSQSGIDTRITEESWKKMFGSLKTILGQAVSTDSHDDRKTSY